MTSFRVYVPACFAGASPRTKSTLHLGAYVLGPLMCSVALMASTKVVFMNDTKSAAVVHVVKTGGPVSCYSEPQTVNGRSSDRLGPGERWTAEHGYGCWSWSPGGDNFVDDPARLLCDMQPGRTYDLSSTEAARCRVDD